MHTIVSEIESFTVELRQRLRISSLFRVIINGSNSRNVTWLILYQLKSVYSMSVKLINDLQLQQRSRSYFQGFSARRFYGAVVNNKYGTTIFILLLIYASKYLIILKTKAANKSVTFFNNTSLIYIYIFFYKKNI